MGAWVPPLREIPVTRHDVNAVLQVEPLTKFEAQLLRNDDFLPQWEHNVDLAKPGCSESWCCHCKANTIEDDDITNVYEFMFCHCPKCNRVYRYEWEDAVPEDYEEHAMDEPADPPVQMRWWQKELVATVAFITGGSVRWQ